MSAAPVRYPPHPSGKPLKPAGSHCASSRMLTATPAFAYRCTRTRAYPPARARRPCPCLAVLAASAVLAPTRAQPSNLPPLRVPQSLQINFGDLFVAPPMETELSRAYRCLCAGQPLSARMTRVAGDALKTNAAVLAAPEHPDTACEWSHPPPRSPPTPPCPPRVASARLDSAPPHAVRAQASHSAWVAG